MSKSIGRQGKKTQTIVNCQDFLTQIGKLFAISNQMGLVYSSLIRAIAEVL